MDTGAKTDTIWPAWERWPNRVSAGIEEVQMRSGVFFGAAMVLLSAPIIGDLAFGLNEMQSLAVLFGAISVLLCLVVAMATLADADALQAHIDREREQIGRPPLREHDCDKEA